MATATEPTELVSQQARIEARQAAQIASNYICSVIPRAMVVDANLMLEEIEESEDREQWLITLGFDTPRVLRKNPTGLGSILAGHSVEQPERVFKRFAIDQKTGRVLSMKIRSLP